ncbi:MAG: cardiolipin synthase [Lachnospiraceae bacterium]|nr:cardiolipin synthase [Lachnospiraceae bacterium]
METFEKKAHVKNGILRLIFITLSVSLQITLIIILTLSRFEKYAEIIAITSRILAFLLVLAIYSQHKSPSIKMPWIILSLIFPAIGVSLYVMLGLSGSTAFMKKRYEKIDTLISPHLIQNPNTWNLLNKESYPCLGINKYILEQSGFPVYQNTKINYYPDASLSLEAQKHAMKNAKNFIFLEYFAIENSLCWQEIEDILTEKVKEGVDVRVFYDDLGSIGYINFDFAKKLNKTGIKCRTFNPMTPFFNLFLNNRDHRKMTIIDNHIGFTGGYNLANEYFNITSPYGHWKDTGIRLEGDGVRSMTLAFLNMWYASRQEKNIEFSIDKYLEKYPDKINAPGFVQFFTDTPMDNKLIGEDVYLNIINEARKYIYIMTPYLIITDEMSRMLGLAAKKGVDVRIITPGIPDKKIIYKLTRSYYNHLAFDGVRIFEYTPGFCHAKMCVSDDIIATCGTINLDYRSLYHHFEDGCVLTNCDAVIKIKEDFDNTFQQCTEVTDKYSHGRSAFLKISQLFLRLFAPLM